AAVCRRRHDRGLRCRCHPLQSQRGLMKKLSLAASMLGLALVMPAMTDLRAAELKVLAGGSTTGWMNELGAQFERASGHKLVIHFDSTPNLIKQATCGAPFDLAVVPIDVFKD